MEAKRTRSLGATGRPAPHIAAGCSSVYLTAAPAATEPVPIRMKSRRVKECIIPPTENPRKRRLCSREIVARFERHISLHITPHGQRISSDPQIAADRRAHGEPK